MKLYLVCLMAYNNVLVYEYFWSYIFRFGKGTTNKLVVLDYFFVLHISVKSRLN